MTDLATLTTAIEDTEKWEEFLKQRYGPYKSSKETKHFYEDIKAEKTHPSVEDFLKENHERQTYDYVQTMKRDYGKLDKAYMGIWDMLMLLDNIQLDSNTVQLQQKVHAFQMAESMRREGLPRWLIMTALIHDLGKYLYLLGERQWTVVGETFPVGCQFSSRIAYPHFFENNPDTKNETYNSSKYGIYEPHCGLTKVDFSFGHDEYMYMVCKDYLPAESLYIIRYHSFYSCLLEGDYTYLLNEQDIEMMKWVKIFLQYDLFSFSEPIPQDLNEIKPFYEELLAEYFPEKIRW
ncbi:inositol oxygenase [Zychaea mexicana]|uniref:inositol oxygenase n=1 Tax=Zychaea mexicana TaxID=64656 RepID=UPI0022FEBF3F|nr:inositol oxygenase [Zychaea mexicana]KAI9492355.1 inositol oxygenase [Zychaea mexicana]